MEQIGLIQLRIIVSVNLLTSVVDTDYSGWAVFVQCMQDQGKNK